MNLRHVLLLLITILLFDSKSKPLLAQKKGNLVRFDTLNIRGNSYFQQRDTLFYFKADTTLIIADTINSKNLRWPITNSNYFYQNLEDRFSRNRFTKELFALVFTKPKAPSSDSLPKIIASENYEIYAGRTIGEINFQQLAIFGPNFSDTGRVAKSWIERTTNKTHFNTRKKVISRALLLKSGDLLDPFLLPDNERLLRELPFIRDARIYVIPRRNNPQVVDLLVMTKDVVAYSFDFEPSTFNRGRLGVNNINVLGTGHQFNNRILLNTTLSPAIGYESSYRIPNIYRSYLSAEAFFGNTPLREMLGFRLNRRFVTPEIRYAGGFEWSTLSEIRGFTDPQGLFTVYRLGFETMDAWVARAFSVGFQDRLLRDRSRVVWAHRLLHTPVFERPITTADTNRVFHSNTLYLSSASISLRQYYKDQFIYGFGRTEDIPIGYLAEITLGHQWGEFYDRKYAGLRISKADKLMGLGYVYARLDIGSFFRDRQAEQGTFQTDLRFISILYPVGSYKMRQLINVNYTAALQRYRTEYLSISNDQGLRGLTSFELLGKYRLVFNFETMALTPFNFLEFRMITFAFADIGFVSQDGKQLVNQVPFQGYGLGFRLRNDNLAFNIFQLRLAFYPKIPANANLFNFNLTGEQTIRFADFDTASPRVVDFR